MKQTRWVYRGERTDATHCSLRASVLKNRGFFDKESIAQYLRPAREQMHDPYLLPDMAKAVKRIRYALETNQKIAIYGDYDVDGMTSTALLIRALTTLGGQLDYYIPNRFKEGYGISKTGIDRLIARGVQLIITVDCGITARDEAQYCQQCGVDLIISDHHQVPSDLPAAFAVINPKRLDSNYPFDMLAGVGIAYKLAEALIDDRELLDQLLVLACLGTVADIAPLRDENRVIVSCGLALINQQPLLGLRHLIEVSSLSDKEITAGHIGFHLAPRLNAAGRLSEGRLGAKLLISENPAEATQLARQLHTLNAERQALQENIVNQAIKLIAQRPEFSASGMIVVWSEAWHEGVIGIAASKLKDYYYRPTIVLTKQGDILKGSARSIDNFSIYQAIHSQAKHLLRFGGHQQAAGLSLHIDQMADFLAGLKTYCQQHLTESLLQPRLKIDLALVSNQLNYQTVQALEKMKPFGVANPTPLFCSYNLRVEQAQKIGRSSQILKLMLNSQNKLIDVIDFTYGSAAVPRRGSRVDIAYQMTINSFGGVQSIQLNAKDIRLYDPYHNAFTKRYYIYYVNCLVEQLMSESRCDGEVIQIARRGRDDGYAYLTARRPLVVSSYEGLLELAYLANDLAIDFEAQLGDNLAVLANQAAGDAVFYDIPIFTARADTLHYHAPNDHFQLLRDIAGIFFDRRAFARLYKYIQQHKQLALSRCLMQSDDILRDRLALLFFEEAAFIRLENDVINFVEGPHKKFDFTDSKAHNRFELLKRRMYQVSLVLRREEG